MIKITWERRIINVCRFVVFIGLLSGLMYMRIDHIYRSGVALIGLLIPAEKVKSFRKVKAFPKSTL